ncbi:uncharacterized protein A4U43_C07F6430 [Asparagus officinalis]|uniref:Uncharacterized protein n=1 Tax=Asparagus officinalis TaxID=4686 RepID=A0A5P1E9X3_ASPOF|nr:uncharacterized protein A4U43_C07F6430 [Asparagus officinalis]
MAQLVRFGGSRDFVVKRFSGITDFAGDQDIIPKEGSEAKTPVAMEVISGRFRSTLNPYAAPYVPTAYRSVEDFSDEWWGLVKSASLRFAITELGQRASRRTELTSTSSIFAILPPRVLTR